MQKQFSAALSSAVSKHIHLSPTRGETLAWLALLIMQHGSICLWRLAAHVTTTAQTESVRRRFYRFFQYVKLDGAMAARVVVDQRQRRACTHHRHQKPHSPILTLGFAPSLTVAPLPHNAYGQEYSKVYFLRRHHPSLSKGHLATVGV